MPKFGIRCGCEYDHRVIADVTNEYAFEKHLLMMGWRKRENKWLCPVQGYTNYVEGATYGKLGQS